MSFARIKLQTLALDAELLFEPRAAYAAYAYMLACADGTYYTGAAINLDRRLKQHRLGKASKYTRTRLPVTLVYVEPTATWSAALRREAEIKRLTREQKHNISDTWRRDNGLADT